MSDLVRDALARLASALDRLDAASLRHLESDGTRAILETELAAMREDRRKLAADLDAALADRDAAESHLADLKPRIDRAVEALKRAGTA